SLRTTAPRSSAAAALRGRRRRGRPIPGGRAGPALYGRAAGQATVRRPTIVGRIGAMSGRAVAPRGEPSGGRGANGAAVPSAADHGPVVVAKAETASPAAPDRHQCGEPPPAAPLAPGPTGRLVPAASGRGRR